MTHPSLSQIFTVLSLDPDNIQLLAEITHLTSREWPANSVDKL